MKQEEKTIQDQHHSTKTASVIANNREAIPFIEEVYRTLPAEDKLRYQKLLTCEDTDMFEWFMQRSRPQDPDLQRIVDMIVNRVQPD